MTDSPGSRARWFPLCALLAPAWVAAQAALQPPGPAPALAEVRAGMAIPSTGSVRGQLPVRDIGLGATAPASLYHFVSHPGVAYPLGER